MLVHRIPASVPFASYVVIIFVHSMWRRNSCPSPAPSIPLDQPGISAITNLPSSVQWLPNSGSAFVKMVVVSWDPHSYCPEQCWRLNFPVSPSATDFRSDSPPAPLGQLSGLPAAPAPTWWMWQMLIPNLPCRLFKTTWLKLSPDISRLLWSLLLWSRFLRNF